jgi:hypothetical protein
LASGKLRACTVPGGDRPSGTAKGFFSLILSLTRYMFFLHPIPERQEKRAEPRVVPRRCFLRVRGSCTKNDDFCIEEKYNYIKVLCGLHDDFCIPV